MSDRSRSPEVSRSPVRDEAMASPRRSASPRASPRRSLSPRRSVSPRRSRSRSPRRSESRRSPVSPRRGSHDRVPDRGPPPPEMKNPGNSLYVAHLPLTTTEQELETKFAAFGTVSNVHIPRNPRSGEGRGFAFVTMSTDDEATAALALDGKTDDSGRTITVEKSKRRAPREATPGRYLGVERRGEGRGGGGRGYGRDRGYDRGYDRYDRDRGYGRDRYDRDRGYDRYDRRSPRRDDRDRGYDRRSPSRYDRRDDRDYDRRDDRRSDRRGDRYEPYGRDRR